MQVAHAGGRMTPLKRIRRNCFECAGGSYREVKLCSNKKCILHSWRYGRKPDFSREDISSNTRTPLKVIREQCVNCSHGELKRVRNCDIPNCVLFPFRFGKNPFLSHKELSGEEKEELIARVKKARESRKVLKKRGE